MTILVIGPISYAPNGSTPKQKFTEHPRQGKNTLTWHTQVGGWQLACPVSLVGQLTNHPSMQYQIVGLICAQLYYFIKVLQRFSKKFGNWQNHKQNLAVGIGVFDGLT